MSISALLNATRDQLRDILADPDGKIVTVGVDGRPPASCGQLAVVVSFAGARTIAPLVDGGDDRLFDVAVTITHRTAYAPRDRRGAEAARGGDRDALTLADELPHRLVGSWRLIQRANALIPANGLSTNGYVEPFKACQIGSIEEAGADWLSAVSGDGEKGVQTVRLSLTGARRLRLFEVE